MAALSAAALAAWAVQGGSKPFLAHVQCPLPVPVGFAEIQGDGAQNGPIEILKGLVEIPIDRPDGVVSIRVPNHRVAPLTWSGAVDGGGVSCLPVPDWQPLGPHLASGHLVDAHGSTLGAAYVVACGRYVEVDPAGRFTFEGGADACAIVPHLRRASSTVVGAAVVYNPSTSEPNVDLVFEPAAVRLARWQGSLADVEFRLQPEGLVVERARAPAPRALALEDVPGLPAGARITAVGDARCAGVAFERMIGLAEQLSEAETRYHIALP